MNGETNLETLLQNMSPILHSEVYVFLTVIDATATDLGAYKILEPLMVYKEQEGLSLIVLKQNVIEYNQQHKTQLEVGEVFKYITLKVHSSLNAVGLTAAVSAKLTEAQISANVVAAFYHDHIFVPAVDAERAVKALEEFGHGKEAVL
ncbi:MAG: hypothetical protein BKP49_03290 [Treponema sp. CETP13]|nr:MAG: hypothetical protein BKP49_03290 [Treponema sp. CETP13]